MRRGVMFLSVIVSAFFSVLAIQSCESKDNDAEMEEVLDDMGEESGAKKDSAKKRKPRMKVDRDEMGNSEFPAIEGAKDQRKKMNERKQRPKKKKRKRPSSDDL